MLRLTGLGGHRSTWFATDSKGGQLAGLELRHRLRARCKDRIHAAKDTGLRNLLRHGYTQNQIRTKLVAIACELLAWTQIFTLAGQARRWAPRRLRLRIFTGAGRTTPGGRRLRLRIATRWPCATLITGAFTRLKA
jgi:DDE family transposase